MPDVANVADALLCRNLQVRPDKVALISAGERVTYRELADRAGRFANLLKARGLVPGDRLLLALPDGAGFLYAFLGSILAGCTPVLLNPGLPPCDVAFIARDVSAKTVVTEPGCPAATAAPAPLLVSSDGALVEELLRHPARVTPRVPARDDIAFMQFSSGSTGRPKGIPHRHGDVPFVIATFARQVLSLDEHDVVCCAPKLYFVYGLCNSILFPLDAGATAVLNPGPPTPETMIRLIREHRATIFCGVPFHYSLLLQSLPEGAKLESLRLCVSAGEALPESLLTQWMARQGVDILNCLGSTESLSVYLSNRPGQVIPGSCGRVIPPYEVKVADEAGDPLPSGQAGELLVRGGSILPFYWNQPHKTAQTILPGGWLRTGDVFVERDGVYYHQGRSDDLFKVAGQWVSPARIEDALRGHPAVTECAVVAKPVAEMLRPFAYVVLAPGRTPAGELMAEFRDFLGRQLPPHQIPVWFHFVDELPKTPTGKVQRFKLRELAE